jgi:heme/copper-type cytochrome/quinol oxidase subunit 3
MEPTRAERPRMSNGQLGMLLFLLSLTVLFVASLIACVITRLQNPVWRTPEMPALPWGLVLSTSMIFGLSFSLDRAQRFIKRNRLVAVERALWAALLFAALFLLFQSFNWIEMARGYRVQKQTLYPFVFHLLTGLHAAHVLGGFVPLGVAVVRASRREYSSSSHEGLTLCAQYWHFLGAVWLVLLATLYLLS